MSKLLIVLGFSLLMATNLVYECQGALFFYHVEHQVDETKAVIFAKIYSTNQSKFYTYNVFYSITGKSPSPK